MPHNKEDLLTQQKVFNPQSIFWPIVIIGGCLGLILSWGILVGDQQGRVNLLHLLFVYLFIPLLSLFASIVSLFFGKGVNLARLISAIPFLSYFNQSKIRKIQQLKLDKYWFLMQSQAAGIAFSLMSLVAFLILLLVTDINFVWRSTLLNASDLLPFLKIIATPWQFWLSAQPSLSLLEMTQDSRLVDTTKNLFAYGGWWQFILAIQFFYSFLLRLLLLVFAKLALKHSMTLDIEKQLQAKIQSNPKLPIEKQVLAKIVNQIPNDITINNWANVPMGLLVSIPSLDLNKDDLNKDDLNKPNFIKAGPNASAAEQLIAERWQAPQLVLVKAWEPPLGELEDFLQNGQGYLFPIDWSADHLVSPTPTHINEWQRFINKLPQWQIYLPEGL